MPPYTKTGKDPHDQKFDNLDTPSLKALWGNGMKPSASRISLARCVNLWYQRIYLSAEEGLPLWANLSQRTCRLFAGGLRMDVHSQTWIGQRNFGRMRCRKRGGFSSGETVRLKWNSTSTELNENALTGQNEKESKLDPTGFREDELNEFWGIYRITLEGRHCFCDYANRNRPQEWVLWNEHLSPTHSAAVF